MNQTYQHINSPNNNSKYSSYLAYLKKIYCLIVLSSVCVFSFGQDEINPNGYNAFYFENGKIASEGDFKNGLPEGQWKAYYPSGVLKSVGNKKEGKSEGIWKFYNDEGNLVWLYPYEGDLKNGCAIQYDSLGNVAKETYYVDDKKQGEEIWYFEDGSVQKKLNFEEGKESGIALEFDENGVIVAEQEYSNGYLRSNKKFNQFDENGNKTGVWRDYYKNGQLKSEISFKGGKMDGLSKEFDEQGRLLNISEMSNGAEASDPGGVVIIDLYKEYHPNGKVKLVGGFNKGLKSGIFRKYSLEGELERAYIYKKDTLVSEGMIEAGGIFVGEWTNYYEDGSVKSVGNFSNGLKDGRWTYYYRNGKKEQEGVIKENVLNGQWTWYYQNGQIKKTEFFNRRGKLEGEQVEYDSLGNEIAKGEYYNGVKEGSWFYHVGDFKETGNFVGGDADGIWTHYYRNGKVAFKGLYSFGEPKGKHIYYHKNGIKKKVGKYSGGLKVGMWKEYSDKGELIETIHYKAGEIFKINGFRVKEVKEEV